MSRSAAARGGARRKTALADIAVLMVAMILLWQLGSWRLGHEVLPSPAATLRKLAAIMTDEDFPRHAWETGRAFATALVIALVGGLVIGLMLGAHRLSGDVAEPILVALYSIPKITLYPVILLLFGLGISAKIAFGVIHGIIPVAVFHDERRAQHPRGLFPRREGDAPVRGPDRLEHRAAGHRA